MVETASIRGASIAQSFGCSVSGGGQLPFFLAGASDPGSPVECCLPSPEQGEEIEIGRQDCEDLEELAQV